MRAAGTFISDFFFSFSCLTRPFGEGTEYIVSQHGETPCAIIHDACRGASVKSFFLVDNKGANSQIGKG